MKIHYDSPLVPSGFSGITLWPFGIHIALTEKKYIERYSKEELEKTINHESIHIFQQKWLLGIFFYLLYVLIWIVWLFRYGRDAYRNLPFEKEAYENASNLEYLETCKPFSWINYF
jgi:hypothetical protein